MIIVENVEKSAGMGAARSLCLAFEVDVQRLHFLSMIQCSKTRASLCD